MVQVCSRMRSLALLSLLACVGTLPARAAPDGDRCQEVARRYEAVLSQITAIEVSLTLFATADNDCPALATRLLDAGASVDARDRMGARPLSHAARSGNMAMVDLLLARGAPVDARNLAGSTALFVAAEAGKAEAARRLIAAGADVSLTGRSGATPLIAASYAGNDTIVAALLEHGANAAAPDETGKPAVVYAAASGHLDVMKRLLARGADVNTRYANDLTLLMWAAGPDQAVAETAAAAVVADLLDRGAHVDDRDDRGRTALMIAAEGGHTDVVDLLLSHGADRSLADKGGKRAADLTVLSALREKLGRP